MKKKYYLFAVTLLAAMSMKAQETYQNAKLITQDLNGTARYVGMGGALEALGADISTISSNPAGIGVFRSSKISMSTGFIVQENYKDFYDNKNVHASFDQIGGVFSIRTGGRSFLNFGFNYHKGRNFNYVLNAANELKEASLNKQSFAKGMLGSEDEGGFSVGASNNGAYNGYINGNSDKQALTFDQLDYLNYNTIITDKTDGKFYDYRGKSFDFYRDNVGYTSNYDFNISGNINDRLYWGITLGVKGVHYKGYNEYKEELIDGNSNISYNNNKAITGSGFDASAGIIVRPIDESPFRVGAYIKTPTRYDLTVDNYTGVNTNNSNAVNKTYSINNSYSFKLFSPWKFGVSFGHTIGNYMALGATYEYKDYSTIDTRINNGGYYDWYYNEFVETSVPDGKMNNHTKRTLKGVSTLKFGAEFRPTGILAIRLGYNYLTSAYRNNGQKDPTLASLGNSYSSEADFTNWKDINRFTFGLGFKIKKFNIDLAYQYSMQKGNFYPFSNIEKSNVIAPTEVANNRSQLLLTLSYHL